MLRTTPDVKPALDYLAYVILRALELGLLLTPVGVGLRIGRGLGLVAWWLDGRHRRTAVANVRQVYGDRLTRAESRRLARRSFQHMGSVFVEGIYLPRLITPATWDRYAVLRGYGPVLRSLLSSQGAIAVTAHLGNWELCSYVSAVLGFPMFSIARPPSNPYVARRVREVRRASGQELIDKRGAWERMEEVLESGGMLAFLVDQHAGRGGVWVDFLGRPASTHKAVALLALSRNVPIIVGYTYRIGRGFRYVLKAAEVIRPADYAEDPHAVERITQRFSTTLGAAILRHPEQWLWAHRRWRERGRRVTHRVPAARPAPV